MKTVLTIFEKTPGAAMQAIAEAPVDADELELRIDRFSDCAISGVDLARFRALSDKPMILTSRSAAGAPCAPFDPSLVRRGVDAGFDYIDVEYEGVTDPSLLDRYRNQLILSHHDFRGVPDLGALESGMNRFGCARVKIAATPQSFGDNLRILEALTNGTRAGIASSSLSDVDSEVTVNRRTLFGMGQLGLYSRILAPLFGSEMHFVARDERSLAAPGQLTLERSLAILGREPNGWPDALFAVVGEHVAMSGSPVIHNARFRRNQLSAAYSIAETSELNDVMRHLVAGERFAPTGLSITAPFKEAAFRFALETGAVIGPNARRARAVNTVVRSFQHKSPDRGLMSATQVHGGLVADNTDVDGFSAILGQIDPMKRSRAAVIGSGGTARAAIVALQDAGIPGALFGRSRERVAAVGAELGIESRSIDDLSRFDGGIVINTVPASSDLDLPPTLFHPENILIDVSYGTESRAVERARKSGMTTFAGMDLLEAQAVRQSLIFLAALAPVGEESASKSRSDAQQTGRMQR
ncbi:MAG TPA: type I 3-dehydroquinate dehydratase [Thermoanaerobaculia bacterium]|nr:type I 3-dehydroquinate dehydratase [Thermoanaerobaculia bacterium]